MLRGIIVSSCHGIREGTAGQRVNLLVEPTQQAFNMPPEVRPADRAPMQSDPVFLTCLAEHTAAELFGVIRMHGVPDAPDRPGRSNIVSGKPGIFGQNSM